MIYLYTTLLYYRDETLKGTELTSKLEPAFMAGLRCVQPQIRTKFFEVFDGNLRRRLHERLMYIVCSQNWESMGPHFWIKQCIELLLVTAVNGTQVQSSDTAVLLPAVTSAYHQVDSHEREVLMASSSFTIIKEEPMDLGGPDDSKEDVSLYYIYISLLGVM